jgi:hypothetical protein
MNDHTIQDIQMRLGYGPYTVLEAADGQVHIVNEYGDKDIVPTVFLEPECMAEQAAA